MFRMKRYCTVCTEISASHAEADGRAALRLDVMGLRLCVLRPASCVLAVEGLRIDCRLVDFYLGTMHE
jgi:hypothetical protein